MRQLLNTLYLSTEGAYAHLEGETLVVKLGDAKRGQVPMHHLGAIVCLGLGAGEFESATNGTLYGGWAQYRLVE